MTAPHPVVAVPHPVDDRMAAAIVGLVPGVTPSDIASGAVVGGPVEPWDRWALQLYRAAKVSRNVQAGATATHWRYPWARSNLLATAERDGQPVAVLLDFGTDPGITPAQVVRAAWALDVTAEAPPRPKRGRADDETPQPADRFGAVDVAVLVQGPSGPPTLVVHSLTRDDLLAREDARDLIERVMAWRWTHLVEGAEAVDEPIADDLIAKVRACTGPERRVDGDVDALIESLARARAVEQEARRERRAIEARVVEAADGARSLRGRWRRAHVFDAAPLVEIDDERLDDVMEEHGPDIAALVRSCIKRGAPESVVRLYLGGWGR